MAAPLDIFAGIVDGATKFGNFGINLANFFNQRKQQEFDNQLATDIFQTNKDLAYNGMSIKAQDLENAGLSKTLLTGGSPATVSSSSTGTAPDLSGMENPAESIFQTLSAERQKAEIDNIKAQNKKLMAEIDNIKEDTKNKGPQGSLPGFAYGLLSGKNEIDLPSIFDATGQMIMDSGSWLLDKGKKFGTWYYDNMWKPSFMPQTIKEFGDNRKKRR